MGKNKFFSQEDVNDEENIKNQNIDSNTSFDSHGNSMNEYSDQIFIGQSNAKEVMFDRKNPIVKLILIVLGLVALLGTIYYIYIFLTTMR